MGDDHPDIGEFGSQIRDNRGSSLWRTTGAVEDKIECIPAETVDDFHQTLDILLADSNAAGIFARRGPVGGIENAVSLCGGRELDKIFSTDNIKWRLVRLLKNLI